MKKHQFLTAVLAMAMLGGVAWGQCVETSFDGSEVTYRIFDADGVPFTKERIAENDYENFFFFLSLDDDDDYAYIQGGLTAESAQLNDDGSVTADLNTAPDAPESVLEGTWPDDVDFSSMNYGAGLEGGDGDPDPANVQIMFFDDSQGDRTLQEVIDFSAFGTDCNFGPYGVPAGPNLSLIVEGATYAEEGGDITMTANEDMIAGGSLQWQKDGSDIGGETGATFVIASSVVGDSGAYTLNFDDGEAKAIISSNAVVVTIFPEGALPVSGLIGLGLLAMTSALGGVVALRKKSK
jgi:hypothetical protein